MFIDAHLGLQLGDTRVSLVCPGCATQSHMTPIAAPTHEELTKHRSGHVGIVYRCDACEYPVFLRHPVRAHGAERIELAPQFIEVEHPREKFAFAYLPRHIESLFRAALDCYAAGAYAGFTLLSRQIALAMFADLGPSGRLRVFEELDDIRELATLPNEIFNRFKDLLFGQEPQPGSAALRMAATECGVLLEVMKDLLSQIYVRKARLQRALKMREFLGTEQPASG